jgi:hypothetical protein
MSRIMAFLLLLLPACMDIETDAQGYKWESGGPKATPRINRDVDVFLYCGFEEKAKSCAVQRGDGICDVYLPKNPESWQEPHELRHCDGWRHPNPLRNAT